MTDQVREHILADFKRAMPKTPEECCLIGARAAIAIHGPPDDDLMLMAAARGLAEGYFADAFKRGSYAQIVIWLDMCEAAMREAVEGQGWPRNG